MHINILSIMITLMDIAHVILFTLMITLITLPSANPYGYCSRDIYMYRQDRCFFRSLFDELDQDNR